MPTCSEISIAFQKSGFKGELILADLQAQTTIAARRLRELEAEVCDLRDENELLRSLLAIAIAADQDHRGSGRKELPAAKN